MQRSGPGRAVQDLRSASSYQGALRNLFAVIGVVSIFTNMLMLTGPLFMLQVYDRVLSSRSEATLVVLFALVAFLYLMYGLLDHARARIAARAGARYQLEMDAPVFKAALAGAVARGASRHLPVRATQDVSLLQQLTASQVFMALFDFPWVPLFIGVIALLHPWLGAFAAGAAVLLAALSLLNISRSRARQERVFAAQQKAEGMGRQLSAEAAQMRSLGMQSVALDQWSRLRADALTQSIAGNDSSGSFGATARAIRLFLQSAMLALGAWLVLRAELSPGGMIAASIILGRALAPLDQLIGGWPQVQAARAAQARLRELLDGAPPEPERTRLPHPKGHLAVKGLALRIPGSEGRDGILLRDVSFEVKPGQALGVIGDSGAGKSSLAEALVGIWPPFAGEIRLDGALLSQYDPSQLGRAIGYLPQRVTLFAGRIRDNIARLDPAASDEDIINAAKAAGAHDLILAQQKGYDTIIDAEGGGLSGGQVQRIALARAFYGNPALLVLDEPNSDLDDEGSRALNTAIQTAKARGASVIIMTHRPTAILECDLILRLKAGQVTAYGPMEEVLRRTTRNSDAILRQAGGAAQRAAPNPTSPPRALRSDPATPGAARQAGGFPWEAAPKDKQ
ncbi:type I secretion system permease/ATPase [Roseibaca sp. Y0-43]|uniref:type I secretion system permease/ATPase n=1 Tax=Roseibaca sp. Y0-43 TaxID=2816854 RepID=UPI001D0C1E3A|nr:type I secretion system permease/ATPase [Roseibaca sp. Y0-43]MCC1480363.1 type I secretion system permease/ATPase [Roseibaca sp. Y0-43]